MPKAKSSVSTRYVTPPEVLGILLERITPYCPAKLLIMGNFNAILSLDLDRQTMPKHSSDDLQAWVQAAGLTVVWQWKHQTTDLILASPLPTKPPHASTFHLPILLCWPMFRRHTYQVVYQITHFCSYFYVHLPFVMRPCGIWPCIGSPIW